MAIAGTIIGNDTRHHKAPCSFGSLLANSSDEATDSTLPLRRKLFFDSGISSPYRPKVISSRVR